MPATMEPQTFKPKRLWTAGPGTPQEKILREGNRYGIKPQYGAYLITNPQDEVLVKSTLGSRVFEEDIPEGEASIQCQSCKWTSRSMRAMFEHNKTCRSRD